MEQLRRLLESLSLRQRIGIGVAVVAVLVGIFFLVRYQKENSYAVLYSNLGPEDASAVVNKLKESATEYRLSSDGRTISVRKENLAGLRLDMAAAELPKTGRIGFELFDKTTFGITEFAEQVNYHRALEGELERTLVGLQEIDWARVHITAPKDSVFADQRRPAKASVLIRLAAGRKLSDRNIKGTTHLIANAVEGLEPDMVSILDENGNLLTLQEPPPAPRESMVNESLLAFRRAVERDMLAKLNSTLEPLLGPDRFRAAVSVECDFTTTEQSDEIFDPERSVMTNSQRSEDESVDARPAGVPGSPSNLPRPTSRPASIGQTVVRRTENINYQSTRVVRRTQTPQGVIRRVSASVLIDHLLNDKTVNGKMVKVVEPPSPERVKATRDIVAGVVGFQAERGDQVFVEAIPFDTTVRQTSPPPGTGGPGVPAADWFSDAWKRKDPLLLGLVAAGALVPLLLLAGMFVLLRRNKAKIVLAPTEEKEISAPDSAAVPQIDEGETGAVEASPDGAAPGLPAGPAAIEDAAHARKAADRSHDPAQDKSDDTDNVRRKREQEVQEFLASRRAEHMTKEFEQEREILASLGVNIKLPSASSKKAELLSKQLIDQAKRDPESIARIVRSWIAEAD